MHLVGFTIETSSYVFGHSMGAIIRESSQWLKQCFRNGPLYTPMIGGDFMHLLCVYSSACNVGFVGWTSTILLQDSVRQHFSACCSENAIPCETGHSCALYDSKTCLPTTEGCHVVLCSFEWTGKLVQFFNTNIYVRINLLIAADEATRLWRGGTGGSRNMH